MERNPLMTTDIFIKSYHKDFPWLSYCLRSIQKFASGFKEIVIVIPDTDDLSHLTAERVVKVKEYGEPYMFQQSVKMHADLYSDADAFVYMDSDCVFTEPVTPESFLTDGRPDWLYTPWEKVGEDAQRAWGEVMTKCIGKPPPAEFMRRSAQLIPRWALQEFRGFIAERHEVSLEHYIMSQPGRYFTEYNCIGFYLWLHHRDKVNWINTEERLPPSVVRQFWSWGGLNGDVKEEIKRLLE
jgi:hypothetical protein